MTRYRYRVYIIDLKKSVWTRSKKFREMNPQYIDGKPCVYVGSTGVDVKKRFEQHLDGVWENNFARDYGKRLRETDMRKIRPRKNRRSIEQKEAEVAAELRSRGWAVWSK
jgi:hypothetical protein